MSRQKFAVAIFGAVFAWILALLLFGDAGWTYCLVGLIVAVVVSEE